MLTFLVASTLPGVAAPTAASSSGAPAPRKFDSAAWGQLSSLVPPPHASLHPLVQRGERSGGRPCGHSQAHGDGGVPAGHRPAEHTTSGDEARGAGGGRGWRHRWWLVVQQRARTRHVQQGMARAPRWRHGAPCGCFFCLELSSLGAGIAAEARTRCHVGAHGFVYGSSFAAAPETHGGVGHDGWPACRAAIYWASSRSFSCEINGCRTGERNRNVGV